MPIKYAWYIMHLGTDNITFFFIILFGERESVLNQDEEHLEEKEHYTEARNRA